MASHRHTDSDNGALGGQGCQSITDNNVADTAQVTPDPDAKKVKNPGLFRRFSRSLRKTFTVDKVDENDPEILEMKAREKRWKAQAEEEVNGPLRAPDINSLEGPGRPLLKSPLPRYSFDYVNTHDYNRELAEQELERISKQNLRGQKGYQKQFGLREPKPARTQSLIQPTSRTRPTAYQERLDLREPKPARTQSLIQPTPRTRPTRRSNTMTSSLGRSGSLGQRFPGDMSHRPLDQIKRETRAANRAPHLRKTSLPHADPIDSLDNVMGSYYHHEGPFDPTLASRNMNKKYAPVEAVKTTNMEALKATPREFVQDSLQKHVPLQGTANIPPGMPDFSGRRMSYEEGTDLQRERFASGGPYRRYDDVTYHPDDLKGKGEPSYTIERALKHGKSASTDEGPGVYEMLPTASSSSSPTKNGDVMVHQRSRSSSFGEGPSRSGGSGSNNHSNSSPGKRLSNGLKKRLGGLGRKDGGDA